MKVSTVALVVSLEVSEDATQPSSQLGPQLVAILHDEYEIEFLQIALSSGHADPMQHIYEHRAQMNQQDDEFGDYVEELLSRPFLKPEVQRHGVQWLKSKIRIENYQKLENQAIQVISDYAYEVFKSNPSRTDFLLTSPVSQVRVRVFVIPTRSSIIESVLGARKSD
jgi:hypothetical protein